MLNKWEQEIDTKTDNAEKIITKTDNRKHTTRRRDDVRSLMNVYIEIKKKSGAQDRHEWSRFGKAYALHPKSYRLMSNNNATKVD